MHKSIQTLAQSIGSRLHHASRSIQPLTCALTLAAALLVGTAEAAPTTTREITFSNLSINSGDKLSQIAKGALPVGSILRSVAINAVEYTWQPYTSDICVFFADSSTASGTLRVGDNPSGGAPVAATQVLWGSEVDYNYGDGYTLNKTVTTGIPAIDLNSYAVFLTSGYSGTWTGTITLTYDVYQDPATTNDILTFNSPYGPATISGNNITFLVPVGTPVTALAPTFTHNGHLTSPPSGTTLDFTTSQTYTITSLNGSPKTYTVTATPWAVTNGLGLWLDASQLTGLSDGDTVNSWTDMSGQSNNANKTDGSPTFRVNQISGKPVVRLAGGNFAFNRISTIRTVFWVLKENGDNGRFLLGDDGDPNYAFHRGGSGRLWDSSNASANVRNGTTKLMGTAVDGTATSLPGGQFQVISLVTAGDVGAKNVTKDRTYRPGLNGDIAEILIYTTPLSSNQEVIVGAYLASKYGLTTTYPVLPPAAPSGLTATAAPGAVNLSWPAATGATSYTVKRSATSGSGYATVGTATGTSYRDGTAAVGITYHYLVTATNSGGTSGNSNEASAAATLPNTLTVDVYQSVPDFNLQPGDIANMKSYVSTATAATSFVDSILGFSYAGSSGDEVNPNSIATFLGADATGSGVSAAAASFNHVIVDFHGNINIAAAGDYTFALGADDVASVYLDGAVVVQANWWPSDWASTGEPLAGPGTTTIHLTAGVHTFELIYYQGAWGGSLAYTGPAGVTYSVASSPPVEKVTPTLSVDNSPVTYNGSAHSATVTGSVTGAVSNVNYNGSTSAPTDAGTYAITADFAPEDSGSYNNLTGASAGSFVIQKATPSVTVNVGSYTYNSAAHGPNSITTASNGSVSYSYSGPGGAMPTAAGNYTVTATVAEADNYYEASSTPTAFTIAKATPVYKAAVGVGEMITVNFGQSGITPASPLSGPAGNSPQWNEVTSKDTVISPLKNSAGATTSSIGFKISLSDGIDPWGSPGLDMLKSGGFNQWSDWGGGPDAGADRACYISGLAVGKKYNFYIASGRINDDSGSHGSFTTTNTTSNGQSQHVDNGAPPRNGSTWVEGVNYVVFKDVEPDSSGKINFTVYESGSKLMVNGFQLVEVVAPTPSATDITYGQTLGDSVLSGTFVDQTTGATVSGGMAFSSPSTVPPAGIAPYSVTFTPSGADADNYTNGATDVSVTVNKRAVALTGTRNYDGTASAAAAVLTVSNKVGGDVVTVSGSADLVGAGVGAQAITSTSGLTLGGIAMANYTLTGASGAVTIAPAPLTVTADNQSKAQGAVLVFGSGSTQFTSIGLQHSETIGSVTLACPGGSAGAVATTYPITPSAASGGSFNANNYSIGYVDGTLTVAGAADPFGEYMAGAPDGQRGALDTPYNDGVVNLLKYAFNLSPTEPDCLTLAEGGTSGLPRVMHVGGKLRLEFLRRTAGKNPGITYTPEFCTGLGGWESVNVVEISADAIGTDGVWERVVVEDPGTGTARFGRVLVMQQ